MSIETRTHTKEKNITQLKRSITTKTNEIKKLLEEEKVETPLELIGTAQQIFEQTKKEILNAIYDIEKLGGDISKVKVRKRSKVGPFMGPARKVDLKDPRVQQRIKYLDKLHQEIEDRKKIRPRALNAEITI